MQQVTKTIKAALALIVVFFLLGVAFGAAWGAFRLASRLVQSLL